jgi:hypothetical protein
VKLVRLLLRALGFVDKAAEADERDARAVADLRREARTAGEIAKDAEDRAEELRKRSRP